VVASSIAKLPDDAFVLAAMADTCSMVNTGPSPGVSSRGGHIFKIQYWMYAATRGPNMKWGAGGQMTDFKWGAEHHWHSRWRRPWVNLVCLFMKPHLLASL